MERAFKAEEERRSHEKEWFRSQIDSLKRRLSGEKVRLGHIYSFEPFNNKEVSNMIIETDNEASSMVNQLLPQQ